MIATENNKVVYIKVMEESAYCVLKNSLTDQMQLMVSQRPKHCRALQNLAELLQGNDLF